MPTELIPSPDFLAGLHEAICDLIRLIDQPAPDDLRHLVVVVWAKIVSLLLTSSPAAVSSWSETLSLPNSIARLQSLAVEGAPLSEALTSAAKQEELVNYVTAQLEQWREARDTLAICLQWAESVGPAATDAKLWMLHFHRIRDRPNRPPRKCEQLVIFLTCSRMGVGKRLTAGK